MSRARPLALTQHRRQEQRAVPAPVTLAEMDTYRALERQGVDRDMILRVVLPMARATTKKTKDTPELLAARIQIEQLTKEIAALRQALEAAEAPKPVLERAVVVESGLQKLWRTVSGG